MSPSRQCDDDAIEAVVRGEPVDERFEAFVAFAHHVRAAGDRPVPQASATLLALLEGTEPVVLRPVSDPDASRPLGSGRSRRSQRRRRVPFASGLASATTKVASLGLLTKAGLGASVALGGVTAAGAAGVMPDAANQAVRGAIETVSPVEFPEDGTTVRIDTREATDLPTDGSGSGSGSGAGAGGSSDGGLSVEVTPDPANPTVEVEGDLTVDGTLSTLPPATLPSATLPPLPPGVPTLPGVTVPPIPTTLP